MKKILITGAGGFIGGFIVEQAIQCGYETWAGVRKTTNKDYLNIKHIHFIDLKFNKPKELEIQLDNFKKSYGKWDYIIHNLGITKSQNKADFEKINYKYLQSFTDALVKCDMIPQQFILMSSLGVVGTGDEINFTPLSVSDQENPTTHYGLSKYKAEQHVKNLNNFPYVILRPTGVYGPREKDYLMMIQMINNGFDIQVGMKEQKLSFVYVKDLVDIIFSIIERGITRQTFHISDGNAYSAKEFCEHVKSQLGKKQIIRIKIPLAVIKVISHVCETGGRFLNKPSTLNSDKYIIMKQRNWVCSTAEVEQLLNYKPKYDLNKGLKETIEWYKQNKWIK